VLAPFAPAEGVISVRRQGNREARALHDEDERPDDWREGGRRVANPVHRSTSISSERRRARTTRVTPTPRSPRSRRSRRAARGSRFTEERANRPHRESARQGRRARREHDDRDRRQGRAGQTGDGHAARRRRGRRVGARTVRVQGARPSHGILRAARRRARATRSFASTCSSANRRPCTPTSR